MKDRLVALVEAVRLARLELECYRDTNCKASAEWTVRRLGELLEDKNVSEAMALLAPTEAISPSVVPESAEDVQVWSPWRTH